MNVRHRTWIGAVGCSLVLAAASVAGSPGPVDTAGFYVDPDFQGRSDGSPARPWQSLREAQWDAIDRVLAVSNVVVYFSAREADVETNEISTTGQQISRQDGTGHRVTLDGMSVYNRDDGAPDWQPYEGACRHEVRAAYPMSTGPAKRCCVTIRGFKIVGGVGGRGGQIIHYWGGDNVVIEHNDLSHDPAVQHGAGLQFGYAYSEKGEACGPCTNISIRCNVVHDTYGEGIYLGGSADKGLPAHDGILVESNHVYNTGRWGGEGDGIDPKDEISNLVIRGNHIHHGWGTENVNGIPSSSALLAEGNVIHDMPKKGITIGTYWGRGYAGSIIRNNLIYSNGSAGIQVSTQKPDRKITGTHIYNNTVVANRGGGIVLGNGGNALSDVIVVNNIVAGNKGGLMGWGTIEGLDVGHNLCHGNGTDYAAPLRAFAGRAGNLSADPRFVDHAAGDFHLQPDSPCVDAGVRVDVAIDRDGVARPQGTEYDMGAYEFVP